MAYNMTVSGHSSTTKQPSVQILHCTFSAWVRVVIFYFVSFMCKEERICNIGLCMFCCDNLFYFHRTILTYTCDSVYTCTILHPISDLGRIYSLISQAILGYAIIMI